MNRFRSIEVADLREKARPEQGQLGASVNVGRKLYQTDLKYPAAPGMNCSACVRIDRQSGIGPMRNVLGRHA